MPKRRFVSALAAIALVVPLSANAAVLFTDKQTFMAATGATDVSLPNLGLRSSPTTVGNLTFSSANTMNFTDFSTVLSGNHLALFDRENFNVSFNTKVYGFGFAIQEPTGTGLTDGCNTSCVESTFSIELFRSGASVYSHTVQPANNIAAFLGFFDDGGFDSVQIREVVGGIDNELFGNFAVASTVSTVPVPAPLFLLGTALGGLLSIGLRRRFEKVVS